jgi:hypothetical protein
MEIKADASVALIPKGNQIAVNIIFIIAAGFLAAAVWLEVSDKKWILAALVGVVFFCLGGFFWWKSHKNESLQKAHPFVMKVGQGDNSVEVSSDARSLPALDYLKGILGQYSAIFHRVPLPEPSGTVGVDGKPIEGSIDTARSRVKAANDLAQEQSNEAASKICSHINGLSSTSPVIGDFIESNSSSIDDGSKI